MARAPRLRFRASGKEVLGLGVTSISSVPSHRGIGEPAQEQRYGEGHEAKETESDQEIRQSERERSAPRVQGRADEKQVLQPEPDENEKAEKHHERRPLLD